MISNAATSFNIFGLVKLKMETGYVLALYSDQIILDRIGLNVSIVTTGNL